MRTTSLLRHVLQFPRLVVRDVTINEAGDLVIDVAVRGRPRCPGCGQKRPIHQTRRRPRRWRHLDVFGWQCYLRGRVRRIKCQKCGEVRAEAVSWAAPDSDYTLAFEDQVTWLTQRCDKTTVSMLMRIAWRTVGSIIERVVSRRREPMDLSNLVAVGTDELSYRKGQRYLTLVTDLDTSRIIWSKEGRSIATLAAFFEEIGPEACARIRHAAIDMSAAYRKAIELHLPNAEIVYDRFHVQQLMSRAVDELRREEWREHKGTVQGHALKHLRWAMLKNPWNVTPMQGEKLASLPKVNDRLYRGYLLKESFAGIYDRLLLPGWARRRVREWLSWASRSRLGPFVKLARTVREHLDGIVAYFKTGYTNSRAEGLNTKARLATRQAYGFHSADAVRAMIDLRCSGIVVPLPHC